MPRGNYAPRSEEFELLRRAGDSRGERSDCAVISVAAATGVDYDTVLELMTKHGRKPGKGTPMSATEATLKDLGYTLREWSNCEYQAKLDSYPIGAKWITSHHPKRLNKQWKDEGTLLFRSTRHIACIKDGVNLDWSTKNSLRIRWVYQVEKMS